MSDIKLVNLQQGINFRDQGGYRTQDGRRVKSGLLFRSGSLDRLTDQDCQQLTAMQVTHILDYRDQSEIQIKPDRLWDGANYIHVPANPTQDDLSADLSDMDVLLQQNPDDYMTNLYRLLPFNNPAYRQLVALLTAESPKPFVQHCAVGKDRTGVGSALVLFALGVDFNTVMEDYLLTEKTLAPFKEQMICELAKTLTEQQLTCCRTIFKAKESFLLAALEAIKARYQHIDQWLAHEYGLTESVKARIQSFYLEG